MKVSQIDWSSWTPTHKATLVFVFREKEVLLIRKKRGLGEGKINAPGGKVDPGETWEETGLRDTREAQTRPHTDKERQAHTKRYKQRRGETSADKKG